MFCLKLGICQFKKPKFQKAQIYNTFNKSHLTPFILFQVCGEFYISYSSTEFLAVSLRLLFLCEDGTEIIRQGFSAAVFCDHGTILGCIHKRDQAQVSQNQLRFTAVYTKIELIFCLNLSLIPFVNMAPDNCLCI